MWLINPRYRHLADAVEKEASFRGDTGKHLKQHVKRLRKWGLLRGIVMLFLASALIASIFSFVGDTFGVEAEAERALGPFTTLASTFTGAFVVLYFLANRLIGQIEVDILMLLHKQATS